MIEVWIEIPKMGRQTIFNIQIVTIILCSCLPLFFARIERAHSNTSAEIGKFGFIVYNVSEKREPDIKCFRGRFNCTTPVGLCSDDHDKYQLEYVENSDYRDVEMFEHWQCRVRIKEISLADVGPYSMCIRPYIDGDAYDECISKERNIEPVYLAVWERDEYGRICQTKYDKDSADISNNCSALTTQLITTGTTEKEETSSPTSNVQSTHYDPWSTKPPKTVKVSGSKDHYGEERSDGTSTCQYSTRNMILTAVCVFMFTLVLVAVIWSIRRARKKRRERAHGSEGYMAGVSMGAIPHSPTNGHAVVNDSFDNDIDQEAEDPA